MVQPETLFETYCLIRRTEEAIADIYWSDKIKSPVHLSIGQEAVSVGVCAALEHEDIVMGTYRGHALYLAKGGDLNQMIAELYGRDTGFAHGKAGSMHLMDQSVGMVGTSAIVASSVPVALGYAFTMQQREQNSLVVVFTGEGAMDEGVYSESMNFAVMKKLPILFVCENNGYAIYSNVQTRFAGAGPMERAEAFGIPGTRVTSNDTEEIFFAAQTAIKNIREGAGPQFLECFTYRFRDHVGPDSDSHIPYRPEGELDQKITEDEFLRLAGKVPDCKREEIENRVKTRIETAFRFAEESDEPASGLLFEHVFDETVNDCVGDV